MTTHVLRGIDRPRGSGVTTMDAGTKKVAECSCGWVSEMRSSVAGARRLWEKHGTTGGDDTERAKAE